MERPIFADDAARIPGDFPDVIVEVGEITGIAAPEGVLAALQNASAGGFRFGEEEFRAIVRDGDFQMDRGDAGGADVLFAGDQNALAALLYGGASLDDLKGALTVEGDRDVAERFARLFPLPPKAPSTVSAAD